MTTTVDLGVAGGFAILAGTPGITNTGNSVITGNIGLSPATGAGMTAFPPGVVNGTIYSVDATGPTGTVTDPTLLTTAKNNLTTAYTDAAGRTPVTTIATELGGTTLTAGVYDSQSTTFGITAGSGALTLDGQGNANAVFIFEAAAEQANALTVGPGSTVTLVNGASACNVFWRVYGATIDTTATFKGNILALTSIAVANGANIEGRLLARNGQVTLINDTITVSTCTAPYETIFTSAKTPTTTTELPDTGKTTAGNSILWYILMPVATIAISTLLFTTLRKRSI